MAQDLTRQYYDLHAGEYFNATRGVRLGHLWDILTRELPPQALILDLGCGSGRDLRYFSQKGFRVVGIDYSNNLLKLAKNFSNQPVVLGDITHLPFEDNAFDAVWAIGSLLHISHKRLPPVLRQIHRILKPNAQFLASMKAGHGEVVDCLGRLNVFYQRSEWESLLTKTGYEISAVEEAIENRQDGVGDKGQIPWIMSLAKVLDRDESRTSREAGELVSASR